MRYFELIENREQRHTVVQDLKKYTNNNVLISFTAIDKLGINPKSGYNTPLGIYTYPLDEVIDNIQDGGGTHQGVPYMGEQPFLWLMIPIESANVLILQNYNNSDLNQDISKLKNYAIKLGHSVETVDEIVSDADKSTKIKTPGGRLWNITRQIALLASSPPTIEYQRDYVATAKKEIVKWNTILWKILGYDIIIDRGQGIIHENEATQAVVLNSKSIKKIEKFDFSKGDVNKFLKAIKEYNNESIKTSSDAFYHASPVIDAYNIIPNPSTKITKKLIDTVPIHVIADLVKNPSKDFKSLLLKTLAGDTSKLTLDEIHFSAVSENIHAIKFIDRPSKITQIYVLNKLLDKQDYDLSIEELQLEAVKTNASYIQFMFEPSERVQLAAVNEDPWSIEKIKNPSEKTQIAAIKSDPSSIRFIKHPPESVQLAAVEQDGLLIEYFANIASEKVQMAAVSNNPEAFEFILDPTEKLKIKTVKVDGVMIGLMNNPSETVQKIAIANNGYNEYTKDQFSPEVVQWAKKKGYIK